MKTITPLILITIVLISCAESQKSKKKIPNKTENKLYKTPTIEGEYPDSVLHIINQIADEYKLLGCEAEEKYLEENKNFYFYDQFIIDGIKQYLYINSNTGRLAITTNNHYYLKDKIYDYLSHNFNPNTQILDIETDGDNDFYVWKFKFNKESNKLQKVNGFEDYPNPILLDSLNQIYFSNAPTNGGIQDNSSLFQIINNYDVKELAFLSIDYEENEFLFKKDSDSLTRINFKFESIEEFWINEYIKDCHENF